MTHSDECPRCGMTGGKHSRDQECKEIFGLEARVAELEADRARAWAHYAECAGTPLMADVMGERDALRTRVTELEVLIDQKERCQCSDSEACAFVRRIEELEDVLAGVRCCEAACCSQCAAKIAALNIPLS